MLIIFPLMGMIVLEIMIINISEDKDFLKPSRLFTLIIHGTLFITSLRLASFQNAYGIWFYILLELMISCFVLGTKLTLVKVVHVDNQVLYQKIDEMFDESYSDFNMKFIVYFLWTLIMVSFAVEIYLLGPPPALSLQNRGEYFVSGWGTLVILHPVLFGLLLYDRYNRQAIKNISFCFITITILVVCYLLSNKTDFIILLVIWVAARNTYGAKIRIIHLVGVVAVVLFVFVFLYILVYRNMYGVTIENLYNTYGIKVPYHLRWLTSPYLYIECNYDNLYNFILHGKGRTYGLRTLDGIYSIFGISNLYPESIRDNLDEWRSLLKLKSLTTGSMFRDFYQDNGLLGMAGYSMICGYISQYFYEKFYRQRDFYTFIGYSIITCSIFLSFYTNMFTSKTSVINIIISWIITRVLSFHVLENKGE